MVLNGTSGSKILVCIKLEMRLEGQGTILLAANLSEIQGTKTIQNIYRNIRIVRQCKLKCQLLKLWDVTVT